MIQSITDFQLKTGSWWISLTNSEGSSHKFLMFVLKFYLSRSTVIASLSRVSQIFEIKKGVFQSWHFFLKTCFKLI